jgi:zeaxanthin glucosyltransferase
MAHIGLICPPVPGHLNPMATLGRVLISRNHKVTAFQIPSARAAIEAQRLNFYPLGDSEADASELSEAVDKLGRMTGLAALRFSVRCGVALARTVCRYAPTAFKKTNVDLAIVDQNDPAGATVAQMMGLPFVNVVSLPLNRDLKVPPPFVSWAYDEGIVTTLLNRLAYSIFDRLVAPVNAVLNDYRKHWGLTQIRRPDDTFSSLAQLCQITEAFDFPRASKPACLSYLGPFRDNCRPPIPFPYDRLDGRPIVYASFGTILQGNKHAFQTIASACSDLDLQLILSTKGARALDHAQLPGQPIVVESAPQLELLEQTAICITHGGLNTVMESLSCGVPMVALPVTNDQPAVSARVRQAGAGETLSPSHLTRKRMKAVLTRVLENPEFRLNAIRIQGSIQRAGGVEKAADIIENFLPPRPNTEPLSI